MTDGIVAMTTTESLVLGAGGAVVIEEEIEGDRDDARTGGFDLRQALITMRDVDPLSGEPLVDDPVTGAGNDDLWTPPAE